MDDVPAKLDSNIFQWNNDLNIFNNNNNNIYLQPVAYIQGHFRINPPKTK